MLLSTAYGANTECFKLSLTSAKQQDSPLRQYWLLQVGPDLSQTTRQSTQTVLIASSRPWPQPNNKTVHSDSTDCFKTALTLAKQQHSPLRQYQMLQVGPDLSQTTTQSTQTVPNASRRPWLRPNVDRPSPPWPNNKTVHSVLIASSQPWPRLNNKTVHSDSTDCFKTALASANCWQTITTAVHPIPSRQCQIPGC